MNNDLISREALKKVLSGKEYITYTYEYGNAIPVEWVMNAIDNAPTVKPKLKDDIIEAFNLITDQEFEHSDSFWIVTPKGKKIEFEKKRPQGKWVKNPKSLWDLGNCSECGYLFVGIREANYCPKCGAYMKKEAENECLVRLEERSNN